jgi:phosphatidylglycerophosphate synthase
MTTPTIEDVPSFSVWVLDRLRAGKFRPRAWAALLLEAWAHARLTALAQPALARGARRYAAGLVAATGAALTMTAQRHGARAAARAALPLLAATATQAADIWAHLGLHRRDTGRPYQHHPVLGPANTLTAARGWVASWTWTRLVTGTPLDDAELAVALAFMCATDTADGPLARRTSLASPLGRYLDVEADIWAGLAMLLTQIRRGQVPGWFVLPFALRWGMPLALGFARTFANAEPVVLSGSGVARTAGTIQVALALVGLVASRRAASPDAQLWQRARSVLAMGASALLLAALAGHLRRLLATN